MSKIFSNALFEAKERESAVSPVVGVMLMLVVTIIIAATVSAFAGGLVGTADKAPQAAFDIKIINTVQSWAIEPTMTITHLGGDPIDTSRIKIVTMWTNRTTNEVNYRETTALPFSSTPQVYDTYGGATVNLSLAAVDVNSSSTKYHEPYYVIPGEWPGSDPSLWFGNFILHPGDIMKAQATLSQYEYYNPDGYADYSVIKNAELLSGKDSVNVKFIDIPTGNVIFNKDVYVVEG